MIAAVSGDHGLRDRAHQPDRRTRAAERLDLVVAVQIFTDAVADRLRRIAEDRVEHVEIVCDQRLLIAVERRPHFGHDLRQVDLHLKLLMWSRSPPRKPGPSSWPWMTAFAGMSGG